MSDGYHLVQKRKLGKSIYQLFLRILYSSHTTEEESDQAREKVCILEVPSEFRAGAPDLEPAGPAFSAGDVLDGNVLLPTSHAGEEFLDILFDESDNDGSGRSVRFECSY